MRRLFLSLLVALCFCVSVAAQSKVKYSGYATQSGSVVTLGTSSTTKALITHPSATVTVYSPSGTTTIATIYSNSSGTVKANPFTAGTDATWNYFADNSVTYDVRISGSGFSAYTFSQVSPAGPSYTTAGGKLAGTYPNPSFAEGAAAGNLNLLDAKADCLLVGGSTVGDGALLQTCINNLAAASPVVNAVIYFPPDTYDLTHALQDTSFSNAQILLPRSTTQQISIKFKGAVPCSLLTEATAARCATLKTTSLPSGNFIGAKGTSGDNHVETEFIFEDINWQVPPNPGGSIIDNRYLKRSHGEHFKISTGEVGTPTQPTTATSYALRPPMNNIVSDSYYEDFVIAGIYNGIEQNEIARLESGTVVFAVNCLVAPGAFHPLHGSMKCIDYTHGLVITGDSVFDKFKLDLERTADSAWYTTVDDISDAGNHGYGEVDFTEVTSNIGSTHQITQVGAFWLWTENVNANTQYLATPVVVAFRSTNQSYNDSTLSRILFDTNLTTDPYAIHSTSINTDRFTCPKLGAVHISVSAEFAANATGTRQIRLYKFSGFDSSTVGLSKSSASGFAGDATGLSTNFIGSCGYPGDYFFAQAYQSSGGALNLSTVNYSSPIFGFHLTR